MQQQPPAPPNMSAGQAPQPYRPYSAQVLFPSPSIQDAYPIQRAPPAHPPAAPAPQQPQPYYPLQQPFALGPTPMPSSQEQQQQQQPPTVPVPYQSQPSSYPVQSQPLPPYAPAPQYPSQYPYPQQPMPQAPYYQPPYAAQSNPQQMPQIQQGAYSSMPPYPPPPLQQPQQQQPMYTPVPPPRSLEQERVQAKKQLSLLADPTAVRVYSANVAPPSPSPEEDPKKKKKKSISSEVKFDWIDNVDTSLSADGVYISQQMTTVLELTAEMKPEQSLLIGLLLVIDPKLSSLSTLKSANPKLYPSAVSNELHNQNLNKEGNASPLLLPGAAHAQGIQAAPPPSLFTLIELARTLKPHNTVIQSEYLPRAEAHQLLISLNSETQTPYPVVSFHPTLSQATPPYVHVTFSSSLPSATQLDICMVLHSPFSDVSKKNALPFQWIEILLPITHPLLHTALQLTNGRGKPYFIQKCTEGKVAYDPHTQCLLWRLGGGTFGYVNLMSNRLTCTLNISLPSPLDQPVFAAQHPPLLIQYEILNHSVSGMDIYVSQVRDKKTGEHLAAWERRKTRGKCYVTFR